MERLSLASVETTLEVVRTMYPHVTDVAHLGDGAWSQVFSFNSEKDGKKYVMRWSKNRQTFDRDDLAFRLFNSSNLPLPQVFNVGEAGTLAYAISEFREGEFLESLPSDRLVKTIPSIISLFDGLRSVDLIKTTGYGFWDASGKGEYKSWKEYLMSVNQDQPKRLTYGWRDKLHGHAELKQGFDELYNELESHVTICPENRYLVHSDLINRNVLVKGERINAVLDWGSSVFGDYLYDLAWFVYYESYYPVFQRNKLIDNLKQHLNPSGADTTNLKERMVCYLLHIGLDSIGFNLYQDKLSEAQKVIKYTRNIVAATNAGMW